MKNPERRKILNPFVNQYSEEEYQCFGCSPSNKSGMQLNFYDLEDSIEAYWTPQKHYEGFFHVLHGGIQSLLHDEIAGWYVMSKLGTSGVTRELAVSYLAPAYVTDKEIRISAKLNKQEGKKALIHSRLYNSEGILCSEGKVEYHIFPLAVARRKHNYPGQEAFFKE